MESLATLAPSFPMVADYRHSDDAKTFRELINQKFPDLDIQHVHHAGNSSGVVDGSAAILWASEDYTKAHGLTRGPASWRWPTWAMTRPSCSTHRFLRREGAGEGRDDRRRRRHLRDQRGVRRCVGEVPAGSRSRPGKGQRQRRGDGAGPPIGATGAILINTALDELERQDKQVGLITMCAGGGMAPAIIIERV